MSDLAEYAKACLNAGKHVVVEKPLTPTSAEAWELARLAEEKGLVLAVCAFQSTFLRRDDTYGFILLQIKTAALMATL